MVTHAHSDHARYGCRHYLAASPGEHLLKMRVGEGAEFQFLHYGASIVVGGVRVTLFPAGHMLGRRKCGSKGTDALPSSPEITNLVPIPPVKLGNRFLVIYL